MRIHGRLIQPKDGEYFLAVTGSGLAVAKRGDGFPEARESARARGELIRQMGLKPVTVVETVNGEEREARQFQPRFLAMATVLAIKAACGHGRRARAVKPRRPKGPRPNR